MRTLLLALCLAACSSKPAPVEPPEQHAAVVVDARPITPESLTAYFRDTYPDAVAAGVIELDFGTGGVAEEVIDELHALGISTMGAFAAIVPADFGTKGLDAVKASDAPTTTVAGLARSVLIIHDTRGYFEKAWGHKWVASGPADFPVEVAYGVDMGVLSELGVFGDDGEYGGEGYGGLDDY